jgi:hypothetical protein
LRGLLGFFSRGWVVVVVGGVYVGVVGWVLGAEAEGEERGEEWEEGVGSALISSFKISSKANQLRGLSKEVSAAIKSGSTMEAR